MQIPDFRLAFRALEEEAIDRGDLARLISVLEVWHRGDLEVSCAELLSREFRVDPNRVRRWESELAGQPSNRIGPYRLQRKVGQGGMGVVFEAEHPNLQRNVALKILTPGQKDPASIQRFLREVKSAGQFNHPNIVHAYDAGIDGDIPYLAMEFVAGENLFQYLLRTGPLEVKPAIRWLAQATSALWFLESRGWTHGDQKPSNWIITPSGVLKLVDLGLCRPPGKLRDPELIHGSPPYIPPEQLGTGERIDIRSDLYALGATFYHLLTGRPPYEARTVAELARAQRSVQIPPIVTLRPDLPGELVAIIDRLLKASPADRYAGCEELAEAVALLPDAPRVIPPPTASAPASTPVPPKRSIRLAFVAVGAFVCVFAGAYLARSWWSPPTDPSGVDDASQSTAPPETTSDKPPVVDASPWEQLWHQPERDWPAIFAWLDTQEESEDTLERRQMAELAFEEEASAAWRTLSDSVDARIRRREYRRALTEIAAFPKRLRLAAYQLGCQRRELEVTRLREERRDLYRSRVEACMAARHADGARAVVRQVTREPVADREYYLQAIYEGFPARPWLVDAERDLRRTAIDEQEQWLQVLAAIARGELPSREWTTAVDPTAVWLAEFFHAYPELLDEARGASLLERLLHTGLLAGLEPGALALLSSTLGDSVSDLEREVEAAQWLARADAACRAWDHEAAENAWDALGREAFASTMAATYLSSVIGERRRALWSGAFLRSEHFATTVTGDWGERPTMVADFTRKSVLRDWRHRAAAWKRTAEGIGHTESEGQLLECMIPFGGSCDVELSLTPRDGEAWEMIVGYGETAVGLHYLPVGELRVIVGTWRDVKIEIERGRGELIVDRLIDSKPTRLRVEFGAGDVTIDWAGTKTTQSLRHAPPPGLGVPAGFIAWQAPPKTILHAIHIEGAPDLGWLTARANAVGHPALEQ